MENNKLKLVAEEIGTPFFIYDGDVLKRNIERLFAAVDNKGLGGRVKIFVAYFANSNPNIFLKIISEKVGILLQTKEEYQQLKKFGINTKMVVSPSFLSDSDIDFWASKNIPINLASLEEVKYWIEKYDMPVSFRLDLTFGQNQRTGMKKQQFTELSKIVKQTGVTPKSIHIYCGTGSSLRKMKGYLRKTIKIWSKYFPEIKEINLGGGFDFNYKGSTSEEKHFDWSDYFECLNGLIKKYSISDDVKFLFEPGRDILADVGQMVLQVKRVVKFPNNTEVATDGSYVYLPSATKRNRKHELLFLDQNFEKVDEQETFSGKLSGSATLSTDYVLPNLVEIPIGIKENDFIVIQDVGAYGATQHMEFLNKKPCPEVFIDNGKIFLITERGADADKIRYVLENPKELL